MPENCHVQESVVGISDSQRLMQLHIASGHVLPYSLLDAGADIEHD